LGNADVQDSRKRQMQAKKEGIGCPETGRLTEKSYTGRQDYGIMGLFSNISARTIKLDK
jgi:hypothetical protein